MVPTTGCSHDLLFGTCFRGVCEAQVSNESQGFACICAEGWTHDNDVRSSWDLAPLCATHLQGSIDLATLFLIVAVSSFFFTFANCCLVVFVWAKEPRIRKKKLMARINMIATSTWCVIFGVWWRQDLLAGTSFLASTSMLFVLIPSVSTFVDLGVILERLFRALLGLPFHASQSLLNEKQFTTLVRRLRILSSCLVAFQISNNVVSIITIVVEKENPVYRYKALRVFFLLSALFNLIFAVVVYKSMPFLVDVMRTLVSSQNSFNFQDRDLVSSSVTVAVTPVNATETVSRALAKQSKKLEAKRIKAAYNATKFMSLALPVIELTATCLDFLVYLMPNFALHVICIRMLLVTVYTLVATIQSFRKETLFYLSKQNLRQRSVIRLQMSSVTSAASASSRSIGSMTNMTESNR